MNDAEYAAEEAACQVQVQRYFRWNFAVNTIEGAFYWLGMSFAASSTIIPLYVSHLTNSRLLIGLVAAIAGSGWSLPQLLTASYVERLPLKKRMVIDVGFFSERLPFLVMAASAFLLAARSASLALLMLFVTMAWSTLGAGLIALAWQDMVAKIIPPNYRGRLLGLANSLGNAAGVLGAALAALILARLPFPNNFALCMLLTFAGVMASWGVLSLVHEPPLHTRKPPISQREYLRQLPNVLHKDRSLAYYLASRVLAVCGKMGIGFLTVYAVQRWKLSDSQAGLYTTVLLVGQTVSNLAVGILADRYGHKRVLEADMLLSLLCMLVAAVASSPAWMYLVFAGIGVLTAGDILSGIVLPMEFAGPDERPTYMGLANTIPGLVAIVAPLIGGWIASWSSYTTLFVVAAIMSAASWATLHWSVRDPRKGTAQS